MYILLFCPYINERICAISYDALQDQAGYSGTETSLLEISKYLVDQGHHVHIVEMTKTSFENNGIQFYNSINEIKDWSIYDWYSPIFFLFHPMNWTILDRLSNNKTKVLVWLHCFIDDNLIRAIQARQFKTYAQALSNYVEKDYKHIFDTSTMWTIGNAIKQYFIADPELVIHSDLKNSKRGNWIFHPVFERGGQIAVDVFKRIKTMIPDAAKQMHLLSYYTHDVYKHNHAAGSDNNIIIHPSLSKKKVAELLVNNIEYFIYPLTLPNGAVHHDTFGSVILEALASGVIVITWDVACMPSLYGDYIIRLPIPDHIRDRYNPNARFANHPFFVSNEAINMFVDKIVYLEQNPDIKDMMKRNGIEWAKIQTWDKIGQEMENKLLTA